MVGELVGAPVGGARAAASTMAPMIRITESVRIPTPAINVASTMKARKLPESSALSEVPTHLTGRE